jgi:hypothetical protein
VSVIVQGIEIAGHERRARMRAGSLVALNFAFAFDNDSNMSTCTNHPKRDSGESRTHVYLLKRILWVDLLHKDTGSGQG